MKDMFEEYVKSRTLQNWKFWIVSLLQALSGGGPGSTEGGPWDLGHHEELE